MELTIVIVSFKSGYILNRCLDSINSNFPVIVVENSRDEELKRNIEKKYKNVECYIPKENLGYGAANNLGIKNVKTKYLLILNPDTVIYKDALEQLLTHAKKIKDFAMLGPKVIDGDNFEEKEIQHERLKKTEKNIEKSISYVKGFAIFINKEQFEEIGFFDENFFLYFEEIDLCKRVIEKNKKIYYIPEARVKHLGGQSHISDFNIPVELSRNWHWMWSSFYYYKKYNGIFYALAKISPKLFSSIVKVIFYSLTFKKGKKEIYKHRLSGIVNSILGNKSWYRPNLND